MKINYKNYIYKSNIKIINNLKKNLIFKIYKILKEELIIIKDKIIYKIYIIH